MNEYPKNAQDFCKKLNLKYPIIQAGMVWVSGGKLAAAAANAGILGIVGAGSMKPELLKEHLKKANSLSNGSIGVNVPLLYRDADKQLQIALDEGIKIFITSAGSPKKYTKFLKDNGATVIHVTSHPDLAKKCEDAGCDMVIAEGFEAGGHNGRDEITTLSLLPQTIEKVSIPVIAAGGFSSGQSVMAGLALGAHGIQMGTRFVCAQESSAHENFQNAVINAGPSDTKLMMKNVVPVRLLKNQFYEEVQKAEDNCSSNEHLIELLGKGRAKAGMLDGDLDRGELEIGQISASITDAPSVSQIVERIHQEYLNARAAFLA
jgi:enoyl-[acyl-carrier protein] reductase II